MRYTGLVAFVVVSLVLGSTHARGNVRTSDTARDVRTSDAARDARTSDTTRDVPTAVTAIHLMVEYQRVGRSLLLLRDLRGAHACGDATARFRAIRLEQALATPAGRLGLAATLAELAAKIERLRGIQLEQACLDNPLAAGCGS